MAEFSYAERNIEGELGKAKFDKKFWGYSQVRPPLFGTKTLHISFRYLSLYVLIHKRYLVLPHEIYS